MEDMLLKQFFDGFNDDDLHYYVQYLKSPDRLDKAVELVYEYDDRKNIQREVQIPKERSSWREEKQNKGKVRSVNSTDTVTNRSSRTTSESRDRKDEKDLLKELTKAVTQMTQSVEKLVNQNQPTLKKSSNERRNSGQGTECFGCGQQGHFAKECPRKSGKTEKVKNIQDEEEENEEILEENLDEMDNEESEPEENHLN